MARPNLYSNVKFKRLVKRLKLAAPYVRGLLDTLWDVANANGNPIIGDGEDVETAAEWPGEPGLLFVALRDGGWLDDGDGKWVIHDYWDHCPDYVKKRKQREDARKDWRPTSGQARQSTQTKELQQNCSDNGGQRQSAADNGRPPARAPAPARTRKEEQPLSPDGDIVTPDGKVHEVKSPKGDMPAGFVNFWKAWPKHFRKKGRSKCVGFWKTRGLEQIADTVIDGLNRSKGSPQWTKNKGEYIPLPLSWLRDDGWEAPAESDWVSPEPDEWQPKELTEEDRQLLRGGDE